MDLLTLFAKDGGPNALARLVVCSRDDSVDSATAVPVSNASKATLASMKQTDYPTWQHYQPPTSIEHNDRRPSECDNQ
jgi:hypothetical protein